MATVFFAKILRYMPIEEFTFINKLTLKNTARINWQNVLLFTKTIKIISGD